MENESTLEQDVRNGACGYIYLNLDYTLRHQITRSSTDFRDNIIGMKEMIVTIARVFFYDRSNLDYQGMIFWYRTDKDLWVHGVRTRKGTPLSKLRRLYLELERISQIAGVQHMRARVSTVNGSTQSLERLLLRWGWEKSDGATERPGEYLKKVA